MQIIVSPFEFPIVNYRYLTTKFSLYFVIVRILQLCKSVGICIHLCVLECLLWSVPQRQMSLVLSPLFLF